MLVSKVGISSTKLPAGVYTLAIGTSKIALDMLTGVASEYLSNVGRTIQFMSDKYGKKMSPEVGLEYTTLGSIILHIYSVPGNHSAYTV
jgi:hypothetical protein